MNNLDSENCVFCKDLGDRLVDECDLTITFRDKFPVSQGHTLIVPKRHVPNYFEITEDEITAMGKAIQKAKGQIDEEFGPDGYNIGMNCCEAGGQTVPHLHAHIIPRYIGDVDDPRGGVRWVLKEKANYWDPKPDE